MVWLSILSISIASAQTTTSWQDIARRLTTPGEQPVRVLHLGDSHLSGGFTTAPMITMLGQYTGQVSVERIGIPGATYATFAQVKNLERIKAVRADLIIISLGTNDSYSARFAPGTLEQNMRTLTTAITSTEPKPLLMLTTPPLSYLKQRARTGTRRNKRGKRVATYGTHYIYNRSAGQAARTIIAFAEANGYTYYDLHTAMAGQSGEQSARGWLERGELHRDRVHYTQAGYRRIGQMIADALRERIASAKPL